MPLERLEKNMGIIAQLDDEPNDMGGLTAAELKAKFDEGGQAVKTYLNETLLPQLEGQQGAAALGAAPFAGVPGTTVQEQLEQVSQKVEDVVLGQIPDGSITPAKLSGVMRCYYHRFEPEEWTLNELRISKSEHALPVSHAICARTIHLLVGRSAVEVTEGELAELKARFMALMQEALAANTQETGTYPTATDGWVQLTWEQVQYYLLEEVLTSSTIAAEKAVELGFNWKERDTGAGTTAVTLSQLLAAAYPAALGGSSTVLDGLWTVAVLRGLRFRQAVSGETGARKKYDLDGRMTSNAWGVLESEVQLDLATEELVLTAAEPFAGELLVIAGP